MDQKVHSRLVKQAFRNAIQNQMEAFKNVTLAKPKYCEFTGERLTYTNSSVHHAISFKILMMKFIQESNVAIGDIEIHRSNDRMALRDSELKNRWEQYHKKHAKLYLMLKEAHCIIHIPY
jgi:hypothetical protein